MNRHEQLVAYLATLLAIVVCLLGSMLIAARVPAVLGKIEVFALGTVFGGLIGVLRSPGAPAATGTTQTGDVTVQPVVKSDDTSHIDDKG